MVVIQSVPSRPIFTQGITPAGLSSVATTHGGCTWVIYSFAKDTGDPVGSPSAASLRVGTRPIFT